MITKYLTAIRSPIPEGPRPFGPPPRKVPRLLVLRQDGRTGGRKQASDTDPLTPILQCWSLGQHEDTNSCSPIHIIFAILTCCPNMDPFGHARCEAGNINLSRMTHCT